MKKYAKSFATCARLLRLSVFASIALSVLLPHSCRAPLILHSATTDTLTIRDVVRDTVIGIPSDSAWLRALIECDSLGRARIKELLEAKPGNHMAPPQADINHGNVLTVKAAVDSFAIYAKLKDRYTEKTSKTVITLPPIEVNILTWWQKFWMSAGKLLTCVVAEGIICYIIIKRKTRQ